MQDVRSSEELITYEEKALETARKDFPGWDFNRIFAGWRITPAGTPVIEAVSIDDAVRKLRVHVSEETPDTSDANHGVPKDAA
jgi:hypothetical protein